MVALHTAFALAACGVLAASLPTVQSGSLLTVGEYFRPSADEVSGDPNNSSAPYFRTPCPALNSLANHGYVSRDGKNITKTQLRDAVEKVFNTDRAFADTVVARLPDTFDYNFISTHGFIEHDASLFHSDLHFGADPSAIDTPLLTDFLSHANESAPFTAEIMGQIRTEREALCHATNPNCTLTANEIGIGFGEAALFLYGFGDRATETISYDHGRSFAELEKFPDDYKTSTIQLTSDLLNAVAAKIQAAASTN